MLIAKTSRSVSLLHQAAAIIICIIYMDMLGFPLEAASKCRSGAYLD